MSTRSIAGDAKTVAPVSAPPVPGVQTVIPEWIRPPRGGAPCPHTGLSRAKLYQLILPCAQNGFKAPVRSVALRTPGTVKGCRLIHLASLLAYINSKG